MLVILERGVVRSRRFPVELHMNRAFDLVPFLVVFACGEAQTELNVERLPVRLHNLNLAEPLPLRRLGIMFCRFQARTDGVAAVGNDVRQVLLGAFVVAEH